MKRLLLLYLFFLLFGFSAFAQFGDWNYSATVSINNTGNANTLTDYSVLVLVNTQTLITEGKMNADGSDIRFTTNFSDNLPYWIEPGIQNERGINNENTYIWVKVPNIPGSGSTTIHMLYGNPSAAAESSISSTFLLGDDFDDNSLDASKWQVIIENSGVINEQNQRLEHNSPPTAQPYESGAYLFSVQEFTEPVVLEMQFKKGGYVYRSAGFNKEYPGFNNTANFGWQDYGLFLAATTVEGATTNVAYPDTYWSTTYNPEYYLKIIRKEDGNFSYSAIVPAFEPGGPVVWENDISAVMPLETPLKVCAHDYVWQSASPTTRYQDNIRVRKYSNPEPTTEIINDVVTDYDGNTYTPVTIGNQVWLRENLKVTHYSNGDPIDNVTDNATWTGMGTGAYCWYNNDYATYGSTYGALYNWYAVADSRNVCPTGWHVPSDTEWYILENFVDPSINDPNASGWRGIDGGTKLKSTNNWYSGGNGTNDFGFTAQPGGYRDNTAGNYLSIWDYGIWWTSSAYDATYSWCRAMYYSYPYISRAFDANKGLGYSVRCIKNQPPPTITDFTPTFGEIGSTVVITGTNFNTTLTNNVVRFGAVQATVTAATSTSLSVTVPTGATYQPITVTDITTGLTAYSSAPFNVTFPSTQVIDATSFAPAVDLPTGAGAYSVAVGDIDGDGKPDLVITNSSSGSVSVYRNNSTSGSLTTSSFDGRVDFIVGSTPYCVAIADIDGDGKLDLIVTNFYSSTVSVFRNTSTAGSINSSSFASRVDFATGTYPFAVEVADIDGDGKPDLVIANYSDNTISILKNSSVPGDINASSLEAKVDFVTGIDPYFIAIGDIDGDQKPDIAVGNVGENSVSLFHNVSTSGTINTSSLSPKVDLISGESGVYPYAVKLKDIDGDGKLDLVIANDPVGLSIFRNISTAGTITTGSFSSGVDFSTGTGPRSIAINDLDGDSKPDIVIQNAYSNSVSVFRNTSNSGSITASSLSAKVDFTTGTLPCNVAICDFDGDGKPDIFVTNQSSNSVSVLHNTITTVATTPIITSFTPTSGEIGSTVVITGSNFNTTLTNNVVRFGAVQATVTAATSTSLSVTVPTGATYQPITVTDITTGLTAYSSAPFNVTFPSTEVIDAASFATVVNLTTGTGSNPHTMVLCDIDGDDKSDLTYSNLASNTISVLRNISSSGSITSDSFEAKVDFPTGIAPAGVAFGDIDGDGKPDLAVANSSGNTVSIFQNTSTSGSITTGSFSSKVDFATGIFPAMISFGDIDGDGKPDMVISNITSNSISVYRNTSTNGSITTGSFATKVDFNTGINPMVVAIGDIDGDGKPDLAVANRGSNTVSVFRNTSVSGSISASSFATKVDFSTGTAPVGLAIGDIDGDYKLDIVATNTTDNSISVFRNTSSSGSISSSSLAAKVDFTSGLGPNGVTLGDLDGDSKLDLAVKNYDGGTISVFRNTSSSGSIGEGSISSKVDFTTGTNPNGIVIGDIDGDGKPDIAVSNQTDNTISIFRNTVVASNLIAYYPFNGNPNDESGNGNNGTEVNGVSLTTDRFSNPDKAYSFDGADDYILVGDPVPDNLQIQNEITLSAWIYAPAFPSELGFIAGSQYDPTTSGASIMLDGRTNSDGQTNPRGHIHFQIGNGVWHVTNSNSVVPLNQWVLITAVRKANEDGKIYYNGQLQPSTSAAWDGSVTYNTSWFAIGQQKGASRPFFGKIDDVRVYNRALTEDEIIALYEEGGFEQVADIDGNVYRTVTIGTQKWMAENLRTTKFSNGDYIDHITDYSSWTSLTSGAYCWYNNDQSSYGNTYGALYNWQVASDSRNVCPTGWEVPSDDDWTVLGNYLGGAALAGGKLKEAGFLHWVDPNTGATNESGFSALPGGSRYYSDGSFNNMGTFGAWWSVMEQDASNAWFRELNNTSAEFFRYYNSKNFGLSIRCIKSNELPTEDFAGGTGTAVDPYQVANAAQLNNVRNYLGVENTDVHFLQIAHINLDESPWNEGEGWEPIGNVTVQFFGNYNSNGYSISGLTINRPDANFVGLFGYTKDANLTNISLPDVNITGNQRVGALAGQLRDNSYAINCSSSGSISGQTFIGGIAGNLYFGSTLNSCYSSADIYFVNGISPIQQAGGLVGRVHESSIIEYCYASGNVGTPDLGYWAGGLVGIISNSSTVSNSYSTGNITGFSNLGGLAGTVTTSGSVINCYSVGRVNPQEPGGGLIGTMDTEGVSITNSYWNIETSTQETSVAGDPKNTYQMIFVSTYTAWDFSSVWNIIQGSTYPYFQWQGSPESHNYPPTYLNPSNLTATPGNGSISLQWRTPSMGNVTEYKVYRNGSHIGTTSTTNHTDNGLTNYTTYSYYVTAVYSGNESVSSNTVSMFPHAGFSGGDGTEGNPYIISNANELYTTRLYLSSFFQQVADIDLGVDPWNTGEGWSPIGATFNNAFRGNYNGNGFTISNLTINKPNDEVVGLFGSTNGATLRNINLVNVNVVGLNYVGPLAGDVNYSTISNVNTSGTTSGYSYVGGIAGGIFHFTNLTKCFSTGTVNASSDLAGGITGIIHNESIVSETYSNASITSTGSYVGGITGNTQTESIISNSYFRGNVSGNAFVGGVAGHLDFSIVQNCYSTGYITGTESTGGLIGAQANGSNVQNSYWDIETSGQTSSAGGEGFYTYQMTSPYEEGGPYIDWDFNDIWGEDFDYDINDGYPYLRMQLPDPPAVATGIVNYTTSYSAKVSGEVFNDFGYTVTTRGIIWDTDADLELEFENYLGIVEAGEGLGSFDAILQPLTPGTEYFARAYAISEAGYGYGDVVSFGTQNETDLCTAVDNCAYSFQTSGDAVWYGQNIYTFDDADAAQSGYITDGQSSWFETTLTGPGNVTYRWKVSSQQDADYLRLYRNGTAYYVITGTTEGWQYVVFDIPEGVTTLRWEYFKDGSGSDGFDCGWVDQFTYIQTGIPSVTSCGANTLTSSSAFLCGNVTSEGYYSVTDRGVVWGSSPDISIDFNEGIIYEGGTGPGSFEVQVNSLSPETQYYYKAFALNTLGAGYGEAIGFTTKAVSTTFFVNQMTGNDGNDGKSWGAAFATLQRALDEPIPEDVEKMGIWVAAGDYKPSYTHGLSTEIQYRHFRMRNNVEIYGGFAGTETTIDQRNISANITYLSGDNYSDDYYGGMWYNRTDNCYHVFYHPGLNLNSSAVLDGFTIRFGNAVSDGNFNKGGGMFNSNSNPTLRNVIFTHNNATYGGGALYNEASESVISNSKFISNTTQSGVGGAAVLISNSYETYVNVIFDQNISSSYGGAISLLNGSSPVFINSLFTNNQASTVGGAIYTEISTPAIVNSTFYNNNYIAIANYSGNLHITNTIIWGNTGGSIYNNNPYEITITYSNIEYGYDGEGNINEDPQFVNASSGNLRLSGTSPCMDTGVNWPFEPDQIADGITDDLDGNPRIVNSYIDMGCYEYQGAPAELPILTTNSVTGVTVNSATSGGNITSDNGYAVTQRGVVWSDSQIPTITAYSGITNNGTGTGGFTSSLTGLTAGTTYKVRAYAVNEKGVGYGQFEEFTTQLVSFSGISATPDYYSATISLTLQNAYNLYYTVRYGKQPDLSDAISTSPAYISSNYFTTQASLSGLDENTVYYYQIRVETNDGPNYSEIFNFRTLCSYTITTSTPSGTNSVCAGSQHTYTTTSPNADSFQWNLNPSNSGTITPNGNSAVVQWSQSFSGNAYVQVSGISGTCNSQMSQLQVEIILNTSSITIAGETQACRESNVLYTLSSQADDYLWVLDEGGTIVSSSSTNALVHWTSTGTYSLQLFEQASTGCPSHTYLNVDVNNINAPQVPQIHRKGSINILICTTPEMDYKWFFNGGTISAQTKQFYVARNNLGDYNVQVTDNANCPNTSDKYNLNTLATELSMLQVYPNPSFGEFTLDIETETFGSASLIISDTFGKVLHREIFNKTDYLLSKSFGNLNLPKGLYIVTVTIGNELPLNTKLTIY